MAKQLEKSTWESYFDTVSKALAGRRVEIEAASLRIGDQVEADWLPLVGITYDPKDNLLDVAIEGVDHMILGPREIWVEGQGLDLSAVEVVDKEGVRQIIMLRDPLMLPAPHDGAHAR